MSQLELLWDYQAADMQVDALETAVKQSPKRMRLLQLREHITKQLANYKNIEEEINAMMERVEVLKSSISNLDEDLRKIQSKVQASPPGNAQETKGYIDEAQTLYDQLSTFHMEIQKIKRNAADRERKQREVKVSAAKSKAEFDVLRVEFDAEFKEKSKEIAELRQAADAKKKGIAPEYLERYDEIKKHVSPPIAKLVNGQCSGCNMMFSSSVSSGIKAGKDIECENCGRMIIL